jgi:Na+/H+-dicarboxylate symporter
MARTATNVTAAAVSATIVAKQEDQLDVSIFNENESVEVQQQHSKIAEPVINSLAYDENSPVIE